MSLELVSAIVGYLAPALVSVVVRSNWASWVKGIVALVSSVVIGFVVALVSGELNGTGVATAIAVVFAASQVAYKTWWQPTGIGPAIEEKTQPAEITSGK